MAQPVAVPAAAESESRRWYRQLNGYHWLVLVVCTLAWLFDCLNQQIFNLTRKPAMADLLRVAPGDPTVARYGGLSTSMLLIGWATGGIFFGVLGDRIGRVKTLVFMILAYSVSTGLCGLARGPWDYIFFCFITGVGAGGIFPVGCTLVAESLPDRTRSQALGMLQAFSALGNVERRLHLLVHDRTMVAGRDRQPMAMDVQRGRGAVAVVRDRSPKTPRARGLEESRCRGQGNQTCRLVGRALQ